MGTAMGVAAVPGAVTATELDGGHITAACISHDPRGLDLPAGRDVESKVRRIVDDRTLLRAVAPRRIDVSGVAEVSTTNAWNSALAVLSWIYALGVAIALMRLAANLPRFTACGVVRFT